MGRPRDREARPTPAKVGTGDVSVDDLDDLSLDPRCRCCGHPLRAARSVALGVGPVCRQRGLHRCEDQLDVDHPDIEDATALGVAS